MKLRNKKTGETFNAIIREYSDGDDDYEIVVYDLDAYKRVKDLPLNSAHAVISDRYKSLAELNKEWEDYEPAEPYIKDKRIRQAVRVWAEINSIEEVIYAERTDKSLFVLTDMGGDDTSIEFVGWVPTLKDGGDYSIAELCGEEEE